MSIANFLFAGYSIEIVVVELNKLFKLMQSAKARSVTPSNRLVELLLSTGGVENAADSTQKRADQFFQQQDVSGIWSRKLDVSRGQALGSVRVLKLIIS